MLAFRITYLGICTVVVSLLGFILASRMILSFMILLVSFASLEMLNSAKPEHSFVKNTKSGLSIFLFFFLIFILFLIYFSLFYF